MLVIYNILFPVAFLFFLPGLLWKLWRRPGWKKTFWERFGIFSKERRAQLTVLERVIWVHSVSVGETVIAVALLKKWQAEHPGHHFVLSTTTTTGQALAREKAPAGVEVIFCPIDFLPIVRRVVRLLRPRLLVILETEIWPNMVAEVRRQGGKVALVNGRMSDHSVKGYRRFRAFFAPVLRLFNLIAVQTEADAKRYLSVCPEAQVAVCGNMKFDQPVPENLAPVPLDGYFGASERLVLLAASTHPGEEALVAATWQKLQKDFPQLKLVIIPRHAERGAEIMEVLKKQAVSACRRSLGQEPASPVDCLLADTTGEMLRFMQGADIVIMGKSLAGQDEGHNLIEPALLARPIVTGAVLKNFRFVLEVLKEQQALALVERDEDLEMVLHRLLAEPERRAELGRLAQQALVKHKGATQRNIQHLEELL